jgi:hypothetical protein
LFASHGCRGSRRNVFKVIPSNMLLNNIGQK